MASMHASGGTTISAGDSGAAQPLDLSPLRLEICLRLPGTSSASVRNLAPQSLVLDADGKKSRYKPGYARTHICPALLSLLHSTGEFTPENEAEFAAILDADGLMHEFYDMRGNTFKSQKLADTLCSMIAGTAPRILQVAISPTDALLESINNILVQNGRLLSDGSLLPIPVVSAIDGANALLSSSSVGSASVTSSQRELHRQELAAKDAIIAELRHQQSASSSHVTIASLAASAPTASSFRFYPPSISPGTTVTSTAAAATASLTRTVSPASNSKSLSSPFASLGAKIRKRVPTRLLQRSLSAAATTTPGNTTMDEEHVSSPSRPAASSLLAAASPAASSHAKTVKTRGGSLAGSGLHDGLAPPARSTSPLLGPSFTLREAMAIGSTSTRGGADDVISRHLHSPSTLQALDASLHADLHRRHSPAEAQAAVAASVHLHTVVDDSSTSSDNSSHHPHSAPALSRRPSFFSATGGSFTAPAFDLFSASAKQRRSSLASTLAGKLPLLSSRASPQDVRMHSSPPATTIDDLQDARDDLKCLRDALAVSQAKEAATSQQLDDERSRNLRLLHQASAPRPTHDTSGISPQLAHQERERSFSLQLESEQLRRDSHERSLLRAAPTTDRARQSYLLDSQRPWLSAGTSLRRPSSRNTSRNTSLSDDGGGGHLWEDFDRSRTPLHPTEAEIDHLRGTDGGGDAHDNGPTSIAADDPCLGYDWTRFNFNGALGAITFRDTGTIKPWRASRPDRGSIRCFPIGTPIRSMDREIFCRPFLTQLFNVKSQKAFQYGYPGWTSEEGNSFIKFFSWYGLQTDFCKAHFIWTAPLLSLSPGEPMGSWFYDLPSNVQMHTLNVVAPVLLAVLRGKGTGLISHPVLKEIVNGSNCPWQILYDLAALAGHPRLRLVPKAVVPPKQSSGTSLLSYLRDCDHWSYMLLLTGVVLSDRYYLIVVVENMHESCAIVGRDIEQEVGTYSLSEPLPLSFSPTRLYARVIQRCQTPLGVPHLLMQAPRESDHHRSGGTGNRGRDRQLRQLADADADLATDLDADAIADQVVAALNASRTGGEPLTCYLCGGSHTVAMCPMFKKIIASPRATSVVLGNLRAASSPSDQSAATMRRSNTSFSRPSSTSRPSPRSSSNPATNIFQLGSADDAGDIGIDVDDDDGDGDSASAIDDPVLPPDFC
jgi:hypothetical protein